MKLRNAQNKVSVSEAYEIKKKIRKGNRKKKMEEVEKIRERGSGEK